jgi:hypothetical protein
MCIQIIPYSIPPPVTNFENKAKRTSCLFARLQDKVIISERYKNATNFIPVGTTVTNINCSHEEIKAD